MPSEVITTDRQIAALKPLAARFERRVSGARGLSLRIYPSGLRQFEVRYALKGGPRRRALLGDCPKVSLADARKKATELRLELLNGVDPVAERAAALLPAPPQETLDEVAELYWAAAELGLHGGRRRPKRPRTISNERHLWKRHISGTFGTTAPRDLKRAQAKPFMRSLVTERGLSAASAASIGGLLHSVLAFCVHEEMIDANPMDEVVRRIHQEDFAQALGLPCELKHQRKGRPGRRFDVGAALTVLDQTRDPDAARLASLKTTVFNLCIGNTDNHAKNHAVLYDRPVPPRSLSKGFDGASGSVRFPALLARRLRPGGSRMAATS